MHNNLIILAGGMSSRMKKSAPTSGLSKEEISQALERSKGLISLDNSGRPLLDYLLFNAKKAGYKNIYMVVSEKGLPLFKASYGSKQKDNNFKDLNISFAIQYIPSDREKPLGTADALLQAVKQYPQLNSEFYTVCNSDNLYSTEALFALRKEKSKNAFISYDRDGLCFSSERIEKFAVLVLDKENQLQEIKEKPSPEVIENYRDKEGKLRVSMNLFKFDGHQIFPYLKDCPLHPQRNEKELPAVFLKLALQYPKDVKAIPFLEHVPDLTAKEDILIVKEYLNEHFSDFDW